MSLETIYYREPQLWSMVPAETKQSSSLSTIQRENRELAL